MGNIKILIAEKERHIAENLSAALEELGYEVAGVAGSGEDAVTLAGDLRPRLVLMDITLAGGIDGPASRAIIEGLRIPVTFVAAHTKQQDFSRALEMAPYGCLEHAPGKAELFTVVETALRRFAGELKLREGEEHSPPRAGDAGTGTEQMKAERSYLRSEFKYREMLDAIDDFVFTIDESGLVLYANSSTTDLFGQTPGQIIGTSIFDLLQSEDRGKLAAFLSGESNSVDEPPGVNCKPGRYIELRVIGIGGEVRRLEAKIRSCRDASGQVVAYRGVARDITGKTLAENALKESRERYSDIIESLEDGYYEVDISGRFTLVNSAFARLMKDSREKMVGKSYQDYMDSDTARNVFRQFNAVFKSGKSSERARWEVPGNGGASRYFEASITPITALPGNVLGFRGIVRDLTQERRIQKALQESERNFRLLVENIHDGIFLVDGEGKVLYANHHAAGLTGYSITELKGLRIRDFVEKTDLSTLMKRYNRRVKKGHNQEFYETILKGRNGVRRIIEFSMAMTEWKGSMVDLIIFKDITERKKTEERLKASEERYGLATRSAGVGVLDFNPANDVMYIDPVIKEILGFRDEDVADTAASYLELVHPEDRDALIAYITGHLSGQKEEYVLEYRMLHRDGGVRWFLARGKAVIGPGGRAMRVIGTITDITRLKEVENSLKTSLAEKEVLLREVHHRVKNNFQIITSLLSLQGRSIADDTLAYKFKDAQNRIRAMALIHEKLYQSEEFSSINFSEYINLISRELYQVSARNLQGLELKIRAEDIMLTIAQAIPCGLILNELLTNAFKYAFPVNFQGAEVIEVDFFGKEEWVELTVRDNGVGLPAGVDPFRSETLGLNLVTLLGKNQLKADIRFNGESGTSCSIRFEKK